MDGVIVNRVSVNKAILVQSVNGPNATIIQGAWDPTSTNGPGAVRCAWLTTNSILGGFTLSGGATRADPNHWPVTIWRRNLGRRDEFIAGECCSQLHHQL